MIFRSLGYNPKIMNFAQRSKYARSNAFKHWKQSHMERRPGQTAAMEESNPEIIQAMVEKAESLGSEIMEKLKVSTPDL